MYLRDCPYCYAGLGNPTRIPFFKKPYIAVAECTDCGSQSQIFAAKTLAYYAAFCFSLLIAFLIYLSPLFILALGFKYSSHIIGGLILPVVFLLSLVVSFYTAAYVKAVIMNIWSWRFGELILKQATNNIEAFD